MICDGDVPDNLKYLPGSETVLRPENVNGADYDTAIAVDVSDRSLLGKSEAVFDAAGFRMVIDHHADQIRLMDRRTSSAEANLPAVCWRMRRFSVSAWR